MKIISRFKDYYDWVGSRYHDSSGREFCYVRKDLDRTYYLPEDKWGKSLFNRYIEDHTLKSVSVCGREYLVTSRNGENKWKLVTPDHDIVVNRKVTGVSWRLAEYGYGVFDAFRRFVEESLSDSYQPKQHLVAMSRRIGQPVFAMGVDYVKEEIPVLGDLGFAAVIPAERMYQEIDYFVSNLIHESPDMKPPVEVSNKDKIVQHGFDLKRSFRH